MGLGERLLNGTSTITRGQTIDRAWLYEALSRVLFVGRRRSFDALVAASGAAPGDRVVDVGCGTGYFSQQIALTVGPAGSVLGVDAAPAMVDYASRATGRLPQCRFEVGLAESLPVPSGSVDVVVSSLMVHHLPADLRLPALREMHRILRSGGRLLVADFQPPTGRFPSALTAALTGHAMAHNDVDELERLITHAGFTVTTTGNANAWLRYISARR